VAYKDEAVHSNVSSNINKNTMAHTTALLIQLLLLVTLLRASLQRQLLTTLPIQRRATHPYGKHRKSLVAEKWKWRQNATGHSSPTSSTNNGAFSAVATTDRTCLLKLYPQIREQNINETNRNTEH